MKKISLYMRKRMAQINKDGCLVKKHPMAVLRECRTFNADNGTDANARSALDDVSAAFDRMCNGVGDANDFDYLAHAAGVAEVRAVEIAGRNNPMIDAIDLANAALNRCRARYLKWGKFELLALDVAHVLAALDIYEMILMESSPRQMANAVDARIAVLKDMAI